MTRGEVERWHAVFGAMVAARAVGHGRLPPEVLDNIVDEAGALADDVMVAVERVGWLDERLQRLDAEAPPDLKQRIRDLELERDLAIAARDTARAEARSQRKIAEDAQAGRVAP